LEFSKTGRVELLLLEEMLGEMLEKMREEMWGDTLRRLTPLKHGQGIR
jgi:hypothetical protein